MGRLLILKKDPGIVSDFQNAALFTRFACAALHEDEAHYYVTLIPQADGNPNDEKLMQRWNPYIVSTFTPVHGSSRMPSPGAAYQYVLAHYPIVNLEAVQQFYRKHHSRELDALMLDYCRRYIDFDFIDAGRKSLFVFAKNSDSTEPLPPIDQFPGAAQYPEFLADLKILVSTHLQTPTKPALLARFDNQYLAKQNSPAFFQGKQDSAPESRTIRPSFHP